MAYRSPFTGNATICSQTLRIGLPLITGKVFNHRSTKVIATIGPACWAPDKMAALLDAGISVARFDLGVGDLVRRLLELGWGWLGGCMLWAASEQAPPAPAYWPLASLPTPRPAPPPLHPSCCSQITGAGAARV